jgi:tetratricopeptide (TPR) repeat protein
MTTRFVEDHRIPSVLKLQHFVGNQTVQRLLQRQTSDQRAYRPHSLLPRAGMPDISRDEENVETARQHFQAGMRLFEAGQYSAAITRLERARQIPGLSDNIHLALLYNLGVCNLRLQRFATAVTYFEECLTRPGANPAEIEPLLEQARRGTAGDAANIMGRAGGSLPAPSSDPTAQADAARTLFQQAAALYAAGQYRQAIIIFEQLRTMELTDNAESIRSTSLFNIAQCNIHLGRHATAIIYLEQYLDTATDDTDRQRVETLLAETQRHAGTLTSSDQARMMFRMAAQSYQADDYATALQHFQTLLTLRGLDDNTRSQIEYNIGLCYLRLGRYAEAQAYFQRYLSTHPDDSAARARLDEVRQHLTPAAAE